MKDLGQLIRTMRLSRGWSQEQLAKFTGNYVKKSSIGMYENNERMPPLDVLEALADAFNVPIVAFFDTGEQKVAPFLTDEGQRFAADFDRLDPPGKRTVLAVIESELQRIEEAQPKRRKVHLVDTVPVTHYIGASAAGSPLYAESDAEIIEYPEDVVPDDTDYSVTLSGHSMEPDFPDGCTVFVSESQRVRNGDIVLAWLPSEQGSVCKRIVLNGESLVRLESINKAYEDYTGESLQGALVFGKVIGRA